MDQPSTSPNQPYPAYPTSSTDTLAHGWPRATDDLRQLCSADATILDSSFIPASQVHLQHFDVYQCSQPFNTTVTPSVSPQPMVDLDFGLLLPAAAHYNNSPSPTGQQQSASLDPHQQLQQHAAASFQYGGDGSEISISNSSCSSSSTQLHSSKRGAAKTDKSSGGTIKAAGFKMKRQVQKRASNRPSPIFPSCATPISLVSQHSHTRRHSTIHASSTSGADLPKLTSNDETNRSLSIAIHHQTTQQLKDIETKILRLQADKGRLLKLAQERAQLGGARLCPTKTQENSLNLYLSSVEQLRGIENGLIEEGNCLMFKIGKFYSSLDCAVEKCISLCSSGNSSTVCISDCFPYIKSLLKEKKIKALKQSESGFIHLVCSSSVQGSPLSDSLRVVLDALNEVLHHAQSVQHHEKEINLLLQTLKSRIQEILDRMNNDVLKTLSFEAQLSAQAVIEGNLCVVCAVQQIWDRTHHYGTEMLVTITDSLADSGLK